MKKRQWVSTAEEMEEIERLQLVSGEEEEEKEEEEQRRHLVSAQNSDAGVYETYNLR